MFAFPAVTSSAETRAETAKEDLARIKKFLALVSALAVITLAAGCGSSSGKSTSKKRQATLQQRAIESAQSYLSAGIGLSRRGLIQQLSSSAGEGFAKAVAISAVGHVKANWNKQAVEDLNGYRSVGTRFSRAELIRMLSEDGFTHAQAIYAVDQGGPSPVVRGTETPANPHSEEKTCDLPIATDRSNCQVAYTACSADAPTDVQNYYNGDGPSLDTMATRYAHSVWGSSGFAWQAGYAGCFGALLAEYYREHR